MIEAFVKGEDLHNKTASILLGKSEKEITHENRQLGKALNVGLLYGQSAEWMVRYAKTRYGFEMTDKQAAKARALFFKHYEGLVRWHAKAWDEIEYPASKHTVGELGGFGWSVSGRPCPGRLLGDSADWKIAQPGQD